MKTIQFDKVSDIYDSYVKVDFDIPFFLKETENYQGEILELMCGTGRVSIPLLEAGRSMTCVDYSKGMLKSFADKISNKQYNISLVEMDVTRLQLDKKFGLIFLPFHSISEILSIEKQKQALLTISQHLNKGGTFILTLQNPQTRLTQADGSTRILGKFITNNNEQLIISSMNLYNPDKGIVSGFQFYEIYDAQNRMTEKRMLEINFKPISDSELRLMISGTGMEIIDVYGDYEYGCFDEKTSPFIIYRMVKV